MGMNGPIEINHMAIDLAMNRHEVKGKKPCFDKVLILGRWWIDRIRNAKS